MCHCRIKAITQKNIVLYCIEKPIHDSIPHSPNAEVKGSVFSFNLSLICVILLVAIDFGLGQHKTVVIKQTPDSPLWPFQVPNKQAKRS